MFLRARMSIYVHTRVGIIGWIRLISRIGAIGSSGTHVPTRTGVRMSAILPKSIYASLNGDSSDRVGAFRDRILPQDDPVKLVQALFP